LNGLNVVGVAVSQPQNPPPARSTNWPVPFATLLPAGREPKVSKLLATLKGVSRS
jgi:hypothetical protein